MLIDEQEQHSGDTRQGALAMADPTPSRLETLLQQALPGPNMIKGSGESAIVALALHCEQPPHHACRPALIAGSWPRIWARRGSRYRLVMIRQRGTSTFAVAPTCA